MTHVVDLSPLQKAIRMESMRAELEKEGFTVVRMDWLRRLNETILKRKMEDA